MRTDVFAPRTWLLAAVAGWAVLAWVLALAGMGGRIAATDASTDEARPLPQLPQASPGPLGPLSQYSEIAARPLFSENRQPQPFFIDGGQAGQASNDFDYVLSSVMIVPGLKLAILQPREGGGASVSFKLGENNNQRLPGWSLVELQPRSATFLGPQGSRTLPLRSFDGSGGAGPSATPRAAAGANRPPPAGARPQQPPQPPPPSPANPLTAGAAAKAAAAQGAPTAAVPVPPPSTPTEPAPQTSEERMEAIRKRIQARRQQLQQQQQRDASQNTQ